MYRSYVVMHQKEEKKKEEITHDELDELKHLTE